jgi:hypothetical protein
MKTEYKPNHIHWSERFINVLYALVILALGALGLFKGELLLPGKRTSGPTGIAMHGLSAWLMYAAMACAVAVLLSTVVDHYDRRNNEATYRRFAKVGKVAGWVLLVSSLALHALSAFWP